MGGGTFIIYTKAKRITMSPAAAAARSTRTMASFSEKEVEEEDERKRLVRRLRRPLSSRMASGLLRSGLWIV